MATISTSMTPLEENRQNKIDDSMYAALDKVMANTEQSYDEFVNAFTYLKQGLTNSAVRKPAGHTKGVSPVCTSKCKSKRDKVKTESLLACTLSTNSEQTANVLEIVQKPNSVMDDVEEEILCEDGFIPSRMTKQIITGSVVKFDNFVDPHEDNFGESDDDVEQDIDGYETHAEGYHASFSQSDRQVQKMTRCQATDNIRRHLSADHVDISNMLTSQMTLDKNSTDKLLLNFLADLQNEMNNTISSVQTPAEDREAMSIIVQKIDTEVMSINTQSDKIKSKIDEEIDLIKFDDDDCESALTSCDHSCSKDIKVIINQRELKRMADCEQRHDINGTAKSNKIHNAVSMDSEGLLRTNKIVNNDNSQAKQSNSKVDVLYPGQIQECYDVPGSEHKRYLDFKAKYVEKSANNQITEENDSNVIQAFQLDDDFDYDNVILTPKWSLQELNLSMKKLSQTHVN